MQSVCISPPFQITANNFQEYSLGTLAWDSWIPALTCGGNQTRDTLQHKCSTGTHSGQCEIMFASLPQGTFALFMFSFPFSHTALGSLFSAGILFNDECASDLHPTGILPGAIHTYTHSWYSADRKQASILRKYPETQD